MVSVFIDIYDIYFFGWILLHELQHQVFARLGLAASIREALRRHSGKNFCLACHIQVISRGRSLKDRWIRHPMPTSAGRLFLPLPSRGMSPLWVELFLHFVAICRQRAAAGRRSAAWGVDLDCCAGCFSQRQGLVQQDMKQLKCSAAVWLFECQIKFPYQILKYLKVMVLETIPSFGFKQVVFWKLAFKLQTTCKVVRSSIEKREHLMVHMSAGSTSIFSHHFSGFPCAVSCHLAVATPEASTSYQQTSETERSK